MRNRIAKPFAVSILLASAVALSPAQTVTGTIALPNLPEQVTTNPFTNRVYAAVPNFGLQPFDYLTVIDGRTDTVITNVQIPTVAYAVAVDPFRHIVYVGGALLQSDGTINGSEVVAVNSRTNKIIRTIPVTSTSIGNGIQGLAVNWRTGTLYVANGSDDEVDVIRRSGDDDAYHFTVKARIPVGDAPFGVAVNQFNGTVYATLSTMGGVAVIDPKTNTVTTTTPFGTSGAGIAVDQITGNVFTTNSVASPAVGQVGVLGETGNLLATIPVGQNPLGIAVDYFAHLAFVANPGDDNASVIDGTTNTVKTTVPVSSLFLAVNPFTSKVYISPADPVPSLTVMTEK
jgi:YVTN family beta-propeller protein